MEVPTYICHTESIYVRLRVRILAQDLTSLTVDFCSFLSPRANSSIVQ